MDVIASLTVWLLFVLSYHENYALQNGGQNVLTWTKQECLQWHGCAFGVGKETVEYHACHAGWAESGDDVNCGIRVVTNPTLYVNTVKIIRKSKPPTSQAVWGKLVVTVF